MQRSGPWRREWRDGPSPWWWAVDDPWYPNTEPGYPRPIFISDYLIPATDVVPPDHRYDCAGLPGHYPDVADCRDDRPSMAETQPSPGDGAVWTDPMIRAGFRISRDICGPCHVIDPALTRSSNLRSPGPSFESIANRPGITPASLRQLIASAGSDVPSRPVRMTKRTSSQNSIEVIAAYILSLRKTS